MAIRDLRKLEGDLELISARVESLTNHIADLHREVLELFTLVDEARARAVEARS